MSVREGGALSTQACACNMALTALPMHAAMLQAGLEPVMMAGMSLYLDGSMQLSEDTSVNYIAAYAAKQSAA